MIKKFVKKESIVSNNYKLSQESIKFKNIYDSHSANTIVILDIERATVYEANEFYNHIKNLLDNDQNKIIIDMDKVYFLDSVFFGTLIKLQKGAEKKQGYLKLIVDYNVKPELLSLSNFEGIFEIYPNLFEVMNKSKAS